MNRRRIAVILSLVLVAALAVPAGACAHPAHLFLEAFNGHESPAGSFVPAAVEVDGSHGVSAGDIYVGDSLHAVLDKYAPGPPAGYLCQVTGAGEASSSASECDKSAPGVAAGKIGPPKGIAVDPNSGLVYVSDESAHAVYQFDPSGKFTGKSLSLGGDAPGRLAVSSATGAVFVADETTRSVIEWLPESDHSGTFSAASFGSVVGIAVDNDPASSNFGDVYVADGTEKVVDRFSGGGLYQCQITGAGSNSASPSECDSAGPSVPAGELGAVGPIAVDPTSGHLYVVETSTPNMVREFNQEGGYVVSLGGNETPSGSWTIGSVAISGQDGDLYVADRAHRLIDVFGPDVVLPDATTTEATEVTQNSATLGATVSSDPANGGAAVVECHFQYGTTTAYGHSAPCSPPTPYSGSQTVSAAVGALVPDTTYHFRIWVRNASGSSTGEDRSFTTAGDPKIDVQAATGEASSISFRARINPDRLDTTCKLQYVDQAHFESSGYASASEVPCAPADLGSGSSDQLATFRLTGLPLDATYHYRFVATSAATPSGLTGADQTVTTFGVESVSVEALNEGGEPETQAGAHPYQLVTTISLNKTSVLKKEAACAGGTCHFVETEPLEAGANVKDLETELPPGLIGNPTSLPMCTRFLENEEKCPGDTQVGVMDIYAGAGDEHWHVPLHNLEPSGRYPAEFGAFIQGQVGAWIHFQARTGADYGITADSINIAAEAVVREVKVTVWGVPADQSHESERFCADVSNYQRPCPTSLPPKPLLTNPTSCAGPQIVTQRADTWQEPGVYTAATTAMPGFTGCNAVRFQPELEAVPTSNVADSSSGLHVDLHLPQPEGCEPGPPVSCETTEADLQDAKVVLPPGLVLNPASAGGLSACTPAQIELNGPNAPSCPDAAKVGRVEVDTPLVKHPLPGAVYVAAPHNNPFGSLLAIYVVVDDPETGVIIKLPGRIEADPQTGQLTTTFDENPQLPFEDFKLDFFGGARGVLRTPATCGRYESAWTMTPWSAPESGPPVAGKSPFEITKSPGGGTCPTQASEEPDGPSFEAGTETPTAGSYSPFVLHLHREDGSQELKGIDTTLPPGLAAKLAGVAECPDAAIKAAEEKSGKQEQQSPSCPAGSEVGVVNVAAGAGPDPYWTQGHAYLAGPYKGAPLSVAIVTPATAGPYDLGDVVVRAALYVNPETAQVTVKSDPIPTILQGIRLDVRTINVKMERPDFTLNPTNCEKMAVSGEALSVLGQSAALSDPFQVGGCEALGFKPRLALFLKGQTKRTGHPALRAVLRMPAGGANIARAAVALPHSEFLDQGHIRTICTRVQFAEGGGNGEKCPPASIYGYAKAWSPLLEHPLEGPVYLRSSSHKLPDLVAALNGQIDIALDGRIDSVHGGIRNSFEVVPDAPVSRFVLSMQGGRKGLLQNSTDICRETNRARALFAAQNGRVAETEPLVKAKCKKSPTRHHRRRHGRRR